MAAQAVMAQCPAVTPRRLSPWPCSAMDHDPPLPTALPCSSPQAGGGWVRRQRGEGIESLLP
jgi:hypothetical protein